MQTRCSMPLAGSTANGNGIRDKGRCRTQMLYQTSTNAVRQDFQALIKQWWAEIGIETELRNIDASVFFGCDPGSPGHLPEDSLPTLKCTPTTSRHRPGGLHGNWRCDQAPPPETQWQGNNMLRFCLRKNTTRWSPNWRQTGDIDESCATWQGDERHADARICHDSAGLSWSRFGPRATTLGGVASTRGTASCGTLLTGTGSATKLNPPRLRGHLRGRHASDAMTQSAPSCSHIQSDGWSLAIPTLLFISLRDLPAVGTRPRRPDGAGASDRAAGSQSKPCARRLVLASRCTSASANGFGSSSGRTDALCSTASSAPPSPKASNA